MKKKNIVLSIFIMLFVLAQTMMFSQMSSKQVDSLVETALKKFGVAGASVGIVKDGKIIHSKGYGVISINTGEPVTKNTAFAIASNTKAFTATALAMLVEEGKLSWDDNVISYIPEFKMYDSYVTENFNIKDLLSHRSGLAEGVGDLMSFPDGSNFTFDDVVKCFQFFKETSSFRTKFDYNNLMYLVAGELMERVSKMSWEQFIKTRILLPLEMNNSYTSLSQVKEKESYAFSHLNENDSLRVIESFEENINGAAGGLYSSIEDMCKWMQVHLSKGKYGQNLEHQLFSQESLMDMWTINTVLNTKNNSRYNYHFAGYGLGWFLNDLLGNMSVMHTGGIPGMLSKVWLIPDLNFGIVILTNTSDAGGPFYSVVSKTIADNYLGLDPLNWTEIYYKQFQKRQETGNDVTQKVWDTVKLSEHAQVNIEDYLGIYEDKWFGKVIICNQDNQLWFRSIRSPKLNGRMYFYNENTFAIKWEDRDLQADAFAIFDLNKEGKVQEIRMKGISPNIDFSYDFQDLQLVKTKVLKH